MVKKHLLACPFCGPNDEYPPRITFQRDVANPRYYAVQAPCCDFEGPLAFTEEEAAEVWNKRYVEVNHASENR